MGKKKVAGRVQTKPIKEAMASEFILRGIRAACVGTGITFDNGRE